MKFPPNLLNTKYKCGIFKGGMGQPGAPGPPGTPGEGIQGPKVKAQQSYCRQLSLALMSKKTFFHINRGSQGFKGPLALGGFQVMVCQERR